MYTHLYPNDPNNPNVTLDEALDIIHTYQTQCGWKPNRCYNENVQQVSSMVQMSTIRHYPPAELRRGYTTEALVQLAQKLLEKRACFSQRGQTALNPQLTTYLECVEISDVWRKLYKQPAINVKTHTMYVKTFKPYDTSLGIFVVCAKNDPIEDDDDSTEFFLCSRQPHSEWDRILELFQQTEAITVDVAESQSRKFIVNATATR